MSVELRPDLEAVVRLRILYYVVYELAEGFGATDQSLETIKKGVLEQQLLSKIIINYLDSNGNLVGRATMTIDWDTYRVMAEDERGKVFYLDSKGSISDQVSRVYSVLLEHTNRLRKFYDVKKVVVRYSYTSEVWGNKQKLKAARKTLGTSAGEDLEWSQHSSPEGLDVEFEYISHKLKELRVLIEHNKPKK